MSGTFNVHVAINDHVAMSVLKDRLVAANLYFSSQGTGPDSLSDLCSRASGEWSWAQRSGSMTKEILERAAELVNRFEAEKFLQYSHQLPHMRCPVYVVS